MSRGTRTVNRTGNQYCGPLVLAAIMGGTTAEAAAKIRAWNGDDFIKSTSTWDLRRTLRDNGFRSVEAPPVKRYVLDRLPGHKTLRQDPNGWLIRRSRHPDYVGLRDEGGNASVWMAGSCPMVPMEESTWPEPRPSAGGDYTPIKMDGPTLAEWMRTTKRDPDAYYIIGLPGHWVLVKGRKFVDTFTRGEWVFLRSAPHRRCRVREVWKVTRA